MHHPCTLGWLRRAADDSASVAQALNYNCFQSPGDDGYRQAGQLVNHSVPITMSVSTEDKERLQDQPAIALRKDDQLLAVLRNPEFYQ